MCGIAGFICKNNDASISYDVIEMMVDTMLHRGPDAGGCCIKGKVALGHRRLSIIDVAHDSDQPMWSHDERFVITFNGEIYNYLELKKELRKSGAVFKTNSDTEVIIEAYRLYKENCFNMFNGMWAFCLYDTLEKKLILSRDRFGIKPLYIVDNNSHLVFASEIKAILAGFPMYNEINDQAIYRYFAMSVNENSDEMTFYRQVNIFPQSCYCIIDVDNPTVSYQKYWKVDETKFRERWINGKKPVVVFKELFDDAVKLRLRADVDVGVCLSGGLDSSAIVGCICRKYESHVKTFSSIYYDTDCDESYYIDLVNKKWKTNKTLVFPEHDEDDLVEYFKKILYYHDQPFGGASLYSQFKVMEGAHGKVKVLLDGQGADELFAGYIKYYSDRIRDLARSNLISRIAGIKLLAIVEKEWPRVASGMPVDDVVSLLGLRNGLKYQKPSMADEQKIKRMMPLFTDDFIKKINQNETLDEMRLSSHLATNLCSDTLLHNIPALLHNEDSNSMAFSIESRVPFLDYRIVEFAIALDGSYKIRNQWTKWIIRKACSEYLPRQVRRRKNKMGFPAPIKRWLINGKSREEIKTYIFRFAERDIVNKDTVQYYYNEHMKGKYDYSDILCRFFIMEMWLRMMKTDWWNVKSYETQK